MNSPMVQQMMSNPETGSEGSDSGCFFCFNRWPWWLFWCWFQEDFLLHPPQKKDVPKKGVSFLMKHIELPDSFVLGNFPASKHISVFCFTFPDISWRPSLVAQGHVARHGADESTAKWANGTTSRDCKDAGRSRIASTVPTQLGLTLGWDWHPTSCCCCCCCCFLVVVVFLLLLLLLFSFVFVLDELVYYIMFVIAIAMMATLNL